MNTDRTAERDRGMVTDWGAVLQSPASVLTHPLEPAGTRAHQFDRREVTTIMAGIHARGDRLMLRFLTAHMVVALLLALHFDTWAATLTIGGSAVALFGLSVRLLPRTFFTRCMAGLALQMFVALHIYQLHGLAEMHFFFFTGFTMMLVYQDALAMWPGCLAIIFQHIVFAYFHNRGVPLHFFEVPHITVTRLFYHFGIAIVQVAICGAWAHLLRRQTLRDAWQKTRLREAGVLAAGQLERIQASEAALRDAWERQRAILDNIPDLAWVQDLDGRFVAVNHAFAKTVGRSLDAVIGRTVVDVFGPDVARGYRAEDRRVVADRVQRRVEEMLLDGQGTKREMETIRGPVFDGEGRVAGTIGIARDITDRKQGERERRALDLRMQEAQKLESLGVLAGGIAHDFNNLLVGMLANASLARADMSECSPIAPLLDDIQSAASQAAGLTRQMLAYAGRGPVAATAIDLSEVTREMLPLLRSAISRNAHLRFELADDLPRVSADPNQFRQVVMNLVINASEALAERSGAITVTTRLTAVDGAPFVALEVIDSGIGMDEATRARIFEPFYTTKFTGRGLGLSAVQGIVRTHDGTIRVSSALGLGTTFEVLWPATVIPFDHLPEPAPGRPVRPSGPARLLVIDDEDQVRRTTIRILERGGYTVAGAAGGTTGLELVRTAETPFAAVLVDLTMPGMNGMETLAAIRAIAPGTPAALVSGFHAIDLPADIGGADTLFLHKPFSPADLTGLVERLLAGYTEEALPAHRT